MKENNCECSNIQTFSEITNTQFSQWEIEALYSLGYIHNEALDALSKQPNFLDFSRQERYTFLVPFVESRAREIGIRAFQAPSFALEDKIITEIVGKENKIIRDYFEQGKLNSFQAEGFNYILRNTKLLDNPAELSIVLSAYESFLLGCKNITTIQKAPLISASVIARASSFYWNYAFNNSQSPWYSRIRENFTESTLYKIKWWDLLGAGINCIGCGIAGGGVAGCIGCAGTSSSMASSIAGEK